MITKKAFTVQQLPRFFRFFEIKEAQDDKLNLFKIHLYETRTEHFSKSFINMRGFKKQLVDNRSVIFHDKSEYYNLGQKDVDKLTKLSKIGFSME